MKKTLILLLGVVLLNSCVSTEEKKKADALEVQAKEAKCRADFSKEVYDYGMNKMKMGLEVGMKKELDDFQKMQNDSTATCADLKKAWEELGKKIDVEWNAKY